MISRPRVLSRTGVLCFVGLLGLIYVAADYRLAVEGGFTVPARVLQSADQSTGITSGMDVPSSVEENIMLGLKDVPGLDEVVVLPMQIGGGYQVSATVNLGYADDFDPSVERPMITKVTDQFYRALYSTGVQVEDAQVYFISNGNTIAGSGLGRKTYQRLSQQALSDGASSLVNSITAVSEDETGSPSEAWFEIEQKVAP